MLHLLSLHALAAQRGDGLRPELLALLRRHAGLEADLIARNPEDLNASQTSQQTNNEAPSQPACDTRADTI
jgi:hypothetical protein